MSSDDIYCHKLMFYHLKTSCYYRYGLTSHEWGFVTKGGIAIGTQTNCDSSSDNYRIFEFSICM